MYVTKLRVENVRLLADQDISFANAAGQPRMWTVFLGENGTCKTTLLQLLAAELVGADRLKLESGRRWLRAGNDNGLAQTYFLSGSAGAALPPMPGQSRGATRGNIMGRDSYSPVAGNVADAFEALRNPKEAASYLLRFTSLLVDPLPDGPGATAIETIRSLEDEPEGFFVAGYGAQRTLPQRQDAGKDFLVGRPEHRVLSLFDRRHLLVGTNFFKVFKDSPSDLSAAYRAELQRIFRRQPELLPAVDLNSPDGTLILLEDGTQSVSMPLRSGPVRYRVPAYHMSEGYQSTLAWIADLVGQYAVAAKRVVQSEDMQGVVLLDEIDLHLHPSWQRRLVPILKTVFPKMQFIVTTHSPLVLTGFEASEIVRLEFGDDGLVHARPGDVETGLMDTTEVLDEYFGVLEQENPELLLLKGRWAELAGYTERTPEQNLEFAKVKKQLAPYYRGRGSADDPH